MINVQVERNGTENNMSVLKRFTKKVQSSGVLPKVRSLRYSLRNLSQYKTKQATLKKIARRIEVDELIKLGKMSEKRER